MLLFSFWACALLVLFIFQLLWWCSTSHTANLGELVLTVPESAAGPLHWIVSLSFVCGYASHTTKWTAVLQTVAVRNNDFNWSFNSMAFGSYRGTKATKVLKYKWGLLSFQISPGNEALHDLRLNVYIFLSVLSAAKVGKTSLIMSLVSEEFPDEVCMASVRWMDGSGFTEALSPKRLWEEVRGCLHPVRSRPLPSTYPHLSGSPPSWGDHHTSWRHPREGAHAHCGLFR